MVVHGAGISEHSEANLGTGGTHAFAGRRRLPFTPGVHSGRERSNHRSFSSREVGGEECQCRAIRGTGTSNLRKFDRSPLFPFQILNLEASPLFPGSRERRGNPNGGNPTLALP